MNEYEYNVVEFTYFLKKHAKNHLNTMLALNNLNDYFYIQYMGYAGGKKYFYAITEKPRPVGRMSVVKKVDAFDSDEDAVKGLIEVYTWAKLKGEV